MKNFESKFKFLQIIFVLMFIVALLVVVGVIVLGVSVIQDPASVGNFAGEIINGFKETSN